MRRISTNMPNDDMQFHMRLQEWRMNELQNKMAGQTRVKELRDDPIAAAQSVRYQSRIFRMERYSKNVATLKSDLRIAEGHLSSANSILHRARELALQGANDTYTKDQKAMMAIELNELINELVQTANAQGGDGTTVFAGDRTDSLPFRVLQGNVPGAQGHLVTSVVYTGGQAKNNAEISEGSFVRTNFAGNHVFWAEQQEVMADNEAVDYLVQSDTAIFIDGVRIELKTGDNVQAIIAKINDSPAAARASLDPIKNSLTIATTHPHQLWIEDEAGGTVLQDLGILSSLGRAPNNYATEARVSGGSVFDMLIALRDRLFDGKTVDIGGAALKGVDMAQGTVVAAIADLGARYERLEIVGDRTSYEIPEIMKRNSEAVDLDMAEAILNLKMMEYTQKAALQTAGRVLRPTLLDFLR